ncbi:hypothetical protein DAI22_11g126475 [Oryza sativa Japonica Group]|nr:hypothetical protein DAI22_11g126475 [Oryza sativa Japonica Group]
MGATELGLDAHAISGGSMARCGVVPCGVAQWRSLAWRGKEMKRSKKERQI